MIQPRRVSGIWCVLLGGLWVSGSGVLAQQTAVPTDTIGSVSQVVSGPAAPVAGVSADTVAPPSRLHHTQYPGPRRLRGTIGEQAITMELDSVAGRYRGSFYFHQSGRWLEARLTTAAARLPRREVVAGEEAGWFRLPTLAALPRKGTWQGSEGQVFPLALRETYLGAARYEQPLWELRHYHLRRDSSRTTLDSAFFHRLYITVSLPQNPAAQQRLRRALAPPFGPAAMPVYLDTLLARKQQQAAGYQFHSATDVVYNAHSLFSVLEVTSRQQGPDYQSHEWYTGSTFDLRTGRRLPLAALLVPGYQKRLLALFRQALQQARPAQPGYGDIGGPSPRLPVGGFTLTPAGLVFTYDDRDDARLGQPDYPTDRGLEIELPYADLLPLIRADGPLAPVLRERGLLPKK